MASPRKAQTLHHLSSNSPSLPLLAVYLAPGVNNNYRTQCFQICQNKDLRNISCLLGYCAVAKVGGDHRRIFLFLLRRAANIHRAGVRPLNVRLVWSLLEWGRASIDGAAARVAVADCRLVIGEGTARLLIEVLGRFHVDLEHFHQFFSKACGYKYLFVNRHSEIQMEISSWFCRC